MARWADLPHELQCLIFAYYIHSILIPALPTMSSTDYTPAESSLIVDQVRRLIEAVPSLRDEISKLTEKVARELEQVVNAEARAKIDEEKSRSPWPVDDYYIYVNEIEFDKVSKVTSLKAIVREVRSVVEGWETSPVS